MPASKATWKISIPGNITTLPAQTETMRKGINKHFQPFYANNEIKFRKRQLLLSEFFFFYIA